LFSINHWEQPSFFNFSFMPPVPTYYAPVPTSATVRPKRREAFLSVLGCRFPDSGSRSLDMQNAFLRTAGKGRERTAPGGHYEPSTSPATLSSEFWRNFLPAGKDFTNPALNFLPTGIPFLKLPNQGQGVRGFADPFVKSLARPRQMCGKAVIRPSGEECRFQTSQNPVSREFECVRHFNRLAIRTAKWRHGSTT